MTAQDPVQDVVLKGQSNLSYYILITLITALSAIIIHSRLNGMKRNKKGDVNNPTATAWANLPGLEVIPQPWTWDPTGIIGNALQLLPFESGLGTGVKWSAKFGAMFKVTALTQTYVGLNSAPTLQTLLKSSHVGHLEKAPEMYNCMKPFITNGVLVSTGPFWQHERKLLIKFQAYQNLRKLMAMLNIYSGQFVSNLEALFGDDGGAHPINELICSCFLKAISEVLTGFRSEVADEEIFIKYNDAVQRWKSCLPYRILPAWFLFTPLWKLHPMSGKFDKANHEIFEFTRQRIREHQQKRAELEARESGPVQVDNDEGNPNKIEFRSVLDDLVDGGVEEGQIVDEINTMMFAGYETGATSIHFLFFHLALHPEIQEECQKEIDELFEDPQMCKDGSLTFDAVSSGLKLVERCILEILRLFPPIYAVTRKLGEPLKIDCDSQDILLPCGTIVVICPYIIHRKQEYFPEPEKFNPDRFLPEECAKRHPYAFIPFSGGPRNCLGMKFGMIEMKTMVAHTLRKYFLKTTDRQDDIPILPNVILTPAKDYTFKLIKRGT